MNTEIRLKTRECTDRLPLSSLIDNLHRASGEPAHQLSETNDERSGHDPCTSGH
jgi:hypothetical protein